MFLRQFESPLLYLLILAAGLAFATQDVSDGSIITAILLINAVLGFSQEYRSEQAVEKLSELVRDTVTVKRNSAAAVIDTAGLVPGDIVVLKEGDVVSADLKLIEAASVEVDESQLTGESVQVAKAVQVNDATAGDNSLVFTALPCKAASSPSSMPPATTPRSGRSPRCPTACSASVSTIRQPANAAAMNEAGPAQRRARLARRPR